MSRQSGGGLENGSDEDVAPAHEIIPSTYEIPDWKRKAKEKYAFWETQPVVQFGDSLAKV
jgi:hypothetical protein